MKFKTLSLLTLLVLTILSCDKNDEIYPLSYITKVENNPQTEGFDFPIYSGEMTGWEIPPDPSEAYHEGSFLVHREDGIHPAIDFFREDGSSAEGYEVWAIGDGVVVDIVYDREVYPERHDGTDSDGEWGNLILIQHDYLENGINNTVYSFYAHTKTIEVELNEVVQRNQRIGLVGKTDGVPGVDTQPDHLHFEIRTKNLAASSWPKSSGITTDAEVLKYWTHPLEFIRTHRPAR